MYLGAVIFQQIELEVFFSFTKWLVGINFSAAKSQNLGGFVPPQGSKLQTASKSNILG